MAERKGGKRPSVVVHDGVYVVGKIAVAIGWYLSGATSLAGKRQLQVSVHPSIRLSEKSEEK